MKIIAKLLASLIAAIIIGGCARQARPVEGVASHPAPPMPEAQVTALETTRGLICSKCHTALTVDTGRKPLIAFSHEKHQNRGFHCNQCHTDLAHGKDTVPGRIHGEGIMPGHPQCFVCHDGTRASNKCGYCHLGRSEPNPHPVNWLGIHGTSVRKSPSSCRKCHDESFCAKCHTVDMPHPSSWTAIHGKQLARGDCVRCHPQQDCNACHQRTLPASHKRKGFAQTHGGLAVPGSNCTLCHSKQFCSDCHKLPMPHPSDWTSAHTGPGKTQTDACLRCHNVSECRTCHDKLKITGHPAEFLMPHITETRKDPDPDCRVCHAPAYCATCHPKGMNGKIFPGGK